MGLAFANPLCAQIVDGIAAIVDNRVITFSEVKKQVDPTERILRATYDGQELVDKVKEARLNALKSLIERELIIQDFKKNGFFVPENLIEDRIKDTINSQFDGDRTAFLKTLMANGMSLAQYRDNMRDNIVVQSMRQKNVSSSVIVSPYRIEQYYRDNIRQFVQEKQISLSLIYLRKSVFKDKRKLPDGTEIEIDSQEELLKEVLYKLDTGAVFSEMARAYSEAPQRADGGSLGWIQADQLRPEIRAEAFVLKPGQHSRIITTDDGFYILKVDDVRRESVEPMSEARLKIERSLIQEERQRLEQEWLDTLRSKAFIKMF